MVIPQAAIDRLNNYFGFPHTSRLDFEDGYGVNTECLVWSLPDLPMSERPVAEQYQTLLARGYALHQTNPEHPDLPAIWAEARKVLGQYQPHYWHGIPALSPNDLIQHDPLKGIHRGWWQARNLLQDLPVGVFLGYADVPEKARRTGDNLILAPVASAFDYLRLCGTTASNRGYDTEQIVDKLIELSQQHKMVLVGAGGDWVELVLEHTLKRQEAGQLRKWLVEFCPSIEDARGNVQSGRIALWWD